MALESRYANRYHEDSWLAAATESHEIPNLRPLSSALSKVERRLFLGMLSAVLGTDEGRGCKFALSSPAHASCPPDNCSCMATPKPSNSPFCKFVHGTIRDDLTSFVGAPDRSTIEHFRTKKLMILDHFWSVTIRALMVVFSK